MVLIDGRLAAAELPGSPFAGAHLPVRRENASWCRKPSMFAVLRQWINRRPPRPPAGRLDGPAQGRLELLGLFFQLD